MNKFVCTNLYEYAMNIVNLYRTWNESTLRRAFFCKIVLNCLIRMIRRAEHVKKNQTCFEAADLLQSCLMKCARSV